MPTIKGVGQGRSVDGGHAIEVDFFLHDDSTLTLKIPFENIPSTMHAMKAPKNIIAIRQPGDDVTNQNDRQSMVH